MLENRLQIIENKRKTRVEYVSFCSDGGTHFEENRMSKKIHVHVLKSNYVGNHSVFSTSTTNVDFDGLLKFLHPCMKTDRLIRDMAIDFETFMTKGSNLRRTRCMTSLKNNVDCRDTTRLFMLQSIKFDGEHLGVPITHVYSTRDYHPGNVSKTNESVKVYARFDFVEAMYATTENDTTLQGISENVSLANKRCLSSNNVGIAQIIGIFAVNKRFKTRDVMFYVQWLVEDKRTQSLLSKEQIPFQLLTYEKVLDDRGHPTNVFMRSFISAAEINRPAFVIPKTVLQQGG